MQRVPEHSFMTPAGDYNARQHFFAKIINKARMYLLTSALFKCCSAPFLAAFTSGPPLPEKRLSGVFALHPCKRTNLTLGLTSCSC